MNLDRRIGMFFSSSKKKGVSDPSTAAIHLSRLFFHSAATPSATLIPVHRRHQILLSFLALFSPTVLWENASRGATLLVESHKEAGGQQQEEREAGRGKDLGTCKIHQISLQILDFWVKVIIN